MNRSRAVDRAVFVYDLRRDKVAADAEGRREIRSRMHRQDMDEQLDGLNVTPLRVRR
jgi:hypothetical protein